MKTLLLALSLFMAGFVMAGEAEDHAKAMAIARRVVAERDAMTNAPADVTAQIRLRSAAYYPDDLEKRESWFNSEVRAWVKIQEMRKGVPGFPSDVLAKIMERASVIYGNDYYHAHTWAENQLDAYRKLNASR